MDKSSKIMLFVAAIALFGGLFLSISLIPKESNLQHNESIIDINDCFTNIEQEPTVFGESSLTLKPISSLKDIIKDRSTLSKKVASMFGKQIFSMKDPNGTDYASGKEYVYYLEDPSKYREESNVPQIIISEGSGISYWNFNHDFDAKATLTKNQLRDTGRQLIRLFGLPLDSEEYEVVEEITAAKSGFNYVLTQKLDGLFIYGTTASVGVWKDGTVTSFKIERWYDLPAVEIISEEKQNSVAQEFLNSHCENPGVFTIGTGPALMVSYSGYASISADFNGPEAECHEIWEGHTACDIYEHYSITIDPITGEVLSVRKVPQLIM